MNYGEPVLKRLRSIFDPDQNITWDVLFLASCVFAVSVDPLFLFIPVIDEDNKCLSLDGGLKIVAICLRSITDTIYVADIILQCYRLWRAARKDEGYDNALKDQESAKSQLWSHLVVDILAILPLPHVLGAFWYLFSIERETTCWHRPCKSHTECTKSSFKCSRSSGNYTFVNDYCPVKTENTTFFDFGIFSEAIQSGIVTSTSIPQRVLYSFWWGHRNLSSLGQNLKTSTNVWENCFAILISILGMQLLLYFIENLKNYMQWITKSSKKKTKISENKDLELWILKIEQCCEGNRTKIIYKVQRRILEENKDITMPNLFSCLPPEIMPKIHHCVCLPLLKKVPMLQERGEKELLLLSKHLQPAIYKRNMPIFLKGDVISVMLFITSGSILTDMGEGSDQHIEKDKFLGEELLDWMSNCSSSPCVSKLPISNKNVKTITKVEAFALSFSDLQAVFPELSQAASDAGASA